MEQDLCYCINIFLWERRKISNVLFIMSRGCIVWKISSILLLIVSRTVRMMPRYDEKDQNNLRGQKETAEVRLTRECK